MKIIFALELLLLAAGVAWLVHVPDGPAAAANNGNTMLPLNTPGLDDVVWQASILALKAIPLLAVLCCIYLVIRILPRHLERKHEVERMRAQRPIPEQVTHFTAPRLNLNYGSRGLSDPHSLPALEDHLRILDLQQWFPMVAQHPAHILLLGETGSGKSLHAQALLTERAKTDKILVLDPHANLNDWRGVRPYGAGRNFGEIEQVITALQAEFERRFRPGETVGDPITIFVDEVPALAAEKKEIVPILTRWLREARKTGIRLVMLSQGWEVKSLGIQGEGSVRESLLFLRLGSFALDVADVPGYIQYPAALIRGTGKQEPLVLDTTGLPSLIRDVPPAAVWQPTQALSKGSTTTNGSENEEILDTGSTTTNRERILSLHRQGVSMSKIAQTVYGYSAGAAFRKVKAVIDTEGL